MDLPVNMQELRSIIESLAREGKWDLFNKLTLTENLIKEGKPYKKILREEHGIEI
jgi:hypothetical protein